MGLDALMAREEDRLPRSACLYQRLRGEQFAGDEDGLPSMAAAGSVRVRRPLRLRRRACKAAAATGRWRGATTASGGGGKRRLRLMRLLFLLPARRVAALLAELVRRLAMAASVVDGGAGVECPSIVFSSQWGLPVLSHSASTGGRSARLRAFYLERSLSAGAGSPC
ncbi:hypothetical protein PR202_gb21783 [Eleusine coracana subsp. coracana]|uniref:Uncharacterized protein n=1 Tax=Eleusine coracana subsp. coracana TaxID=191504 RepID=A0AAV5FG29_ELECO|nr:hypothetical protein QOZ80_7BG0609920 [Eleusine coracana subsp. coracana]GJN33210.1 hypothetical protein PR202_gb21783 [Eleusine coracana subsp. coracana]